MAFDENIFGIIDGTAAFEDAKAQEERLRKIGISPEFSGLDYQDAAYSGDFNPTFFDDPQDAAYQTVTEDPRLRQMQMDALQSLVDRASGAADAKANANRAGALDEANQLANSREQAIRMDMERKGQGGSGMDAVLRAQASQMGANRARHGTLQSVADAALEKLTATDSMLNQSGNIRGQDFRANATNADIVNRFNMANTAAKNAARQANVSLQNGAGMRNLDARQGMNNAGAATRNESIRRRDKLAQIKHGNTMERFGMENQIATRGTQGLASAVKGTVGLGTDMVQAGMAGYGGGGGKSASASTITPMAASGTGAMGGSITNPYDDDWASGMA